MGIDHHFMSRSLLLETLDASERVIMNDSIRDFEPGESRRTFSTFEAAEDFQRGNIINLNTFFVRVHSGALRWDSVGGFCTAHCPLVNGKCYGSACASWVPSRIVSGPGSDHSPVHHVYTGYCNNPMVIPADE